VQQLLPVTTNNFALLLPGAHNQAGALKLTIQKFYRIAGGSTQRKGVVPDVRLPSLTDAMDHGEASLKNPLPYDEIPSQQFALFEKEPLPLAELRQRSAARIAQNPDFKWILEETGRFHIRQEENKISLNRAVRQQEIEEQDRRDERRREELRQHYAKVKEEEKGLFTVYSLTLDTVTAPELPLLSDLKAEDLSGMMTARKDEKTDEQKALEPPHGFGTVKREAIEVLEDLVDVQNAERSRRITLSEFYKRPRFRRK
jgi:carboxyl-terminal processing protease